MLLKDRLPEQGNWLFRWRSYLPLGLLPFARLALWDAPDLGETAAALRALGHEPIVIPLTRIAFLDSGPVDPDHFQAIAVTT